MEKKELLAQTICKLQGITQEAAEELITSSRVYKRYLKTNASKPIVDGEAVAGETLVKPRSKFGGFLLQGKRVKMELVFKRWFERVDEKKAATISRFLAGETKSRKAFTGYLKSTGINNVDTFVLLYNLLHAEDELEYREQ